MTNRKLTITLIHHPTVALKISGFTHPDFAEFSKTGAYLGNIYRRIIPPSLPRLAAVAEKELDADVSIVDLRITNYFREEIYKTIDWEGYQIELRRVGNTFSYADDAIARSDWIGMSSHFTFEAGIIRDLIAYAKKINPAVKVMVGGADVSARPEEYLRFGADAAFRGDFCPEALTWDITEPTVVGPYSHPFEELIAPAFDKLTHLKEYTDSHDGQVPPGVAFPIGFIYFTRGCPRECNFCESRKTRHEVLDLDHCLTMIENYKKANIRTLNLADDNLLLQSANKRGRDNLLTLLRTMREMGFAWEYPNGLEIGLLLRQGKLDEELIEALFTHTVDSETGRIIGPYRLYVPVETFDRRTDYRKLKPLNDQRTIIESLASTGMPELDFGVVLAPDADEETFLHTREGYLEMRDILARRGKTKARYAVFHLIPIAEFRTMKTKYSVSDFPEGWNFYFPVYDGAHFSARELFERRLRLIKEVDHENYESMVRGEYSYG